MFVTAHAAQARATYASPSSSGRALRRPAPARGACRTAGRRGGGSGRRRRGSGSGRTRSRRRGSGRPRPGRGRRRARARSSGRAARRGRRAAAAARGRRTDPVQVGRLALVPAGRGHEVDERRHAPVARRDGLEPRRAVRATSRVRTSDPGAVAWQPAASPRRSAARAAEPRRRPASPVRRRHAIPSQRARRRARFRAATTRDDGERRAGATVATAGEQSTTAAQAGRLEPAALAGPRRPRLEQGVREAEEAEREQEPPRPPPPRPPGLEAPGDDQHLAHEERRRRQAGERAQREAHRRPERAAASGRCR